MAVDTLTLTAGQLDVSLDTTAGSIRGLQVTSVYDNIVARELLPTDDIPLCKLALYNTDDETISVIDSSSGWGYSHLETTASGARFDLASHDTYDGISINGEITTDGTNNRLEWTFHVGNASPNLSLYEFSPARVGVKDITEGKLFIAHRNGKEIDFINNSVNESETIPWAWESQYQAIYDGASGLYLGRHDPTPNIKVRYNKTLTNGGCDMEFSHPVKDQTVAGNTYDMSGTAVWQLYSSGDWQGAAEIYRDWVQQGSSWYPDTIDYDGRTDVTPWFKEIPAVINLNVGYPSDYTTPIDKAIAQQEYFGVPMGIHFVNWQKANFNNNYPQAFGFADDGFEDAVQRLQDNDMYVFPYINTRLFADHLDGWSVAKEYACKNENGTAYKETNPSGQNFGVMEPNSTYWQDYMLDIIDDLRTRFGVDGIYLDQMGGPADTRDSGYPDNADRNFGDPMAICRDSSHNHPLGGGSWWLDGYREMAQRIQSSVPDDFAVVGEDATEYYSEHVDGALSWTMGKFDAQIPAHHITYSGGKHFRYGKSHPNDYVTYEELNRVRTAQSLCWGDILGWWAEDIHEQSAIAPFLKKCVQLRYSLTGLFRNGNYHGQMDLNVPDYTVAGPTGDGDVTVPALESAVWNQDPENEVVLVFANPTDSQRFSDFTLDLTQYGMGGNVDVQLVDENGSQGASFSSPPSLSETVTVPAQGVEAWIISDTENLGVTGDSLNIFGDHA